MNEQLLKPISIDISPAQKNQRGLALLNNFSIQQRLPFFIFILLVTVVGAFSWISYIGVKNAGMAVGGERVTTLVDKLSVMFKGSVDQFNAKNELIGNEKSIKEYLVSANSDARSQALDVLGKFSKTDTLCKSLQLLNPQKQEVLNYSSAGLHLQGNIDSLIGPSARVGKIILYKGSMYFPVITRVEDKNQLAGYLVNWQLMKASQESVDQFGQLLGSNGRLYFGNDDKKFWTDLMKPVPQPPADFNKLQKFTQYERKDGEPLIGSMRSIPGSRWLVLVELSSSSFVETAHIFLRWVIIIGAVLIILGSLGGWLMSRNITRPLQELGKAASAIAEGDYSLLVQIDRQDELGSLAESFNIMTIRVRAAQQSLEQKVVQTTRELETAIIDIHDQKESEKRKDEFISIASHELKTPLTTIKAFFQLAVKEISPESKQYPMIGRVSRQVNRMERLIADLLDVSRINSGRMQYDLEDFDFDIMLKEVVASTQEISPDHSLMLEKSEPVIINGDRHRLEQVVINLLNNAVKYSPGENKVSIRSEVDRGNLLVTIQDYGIGINKKHIEGLFERFSRADIGHRFQGLGLGLYISSEIIKRHGGNIHVESEPGKGSSFIIQLPLHQ